MISFCIVNWNGGSLFKEVINSIENEGFKDYEIIIVDNNSTDNSLYNLEHNSKIKIIKNFKNYMFSKATNQSVEASKGDDLIIMNNDIIFQKGSIKYYLSVLNKFSDEVISPQLIGKDNMVQKSIRNLFTPIRFLNEIFHLSNRKNLQWKLSTFPYNINSYVEQPLFSLLFMKRQTFYKVGLLDLQLPLFFNDVDWFYRAKKNNIKTQYISGPVIKHIHGYSVNRKPLKKVFSSTKCMFKYLKKHYGVISILLLPFIIMSFFIRLFSNLFLSERFHK